MRKQALDRLSKPELAELDSFLADSEDSMTLPEAHGFLSAILSAPTLIRPSEWQPMLLGRGAFASMAEAERVLGLVMRLYNQTLADLESGEHAGPMVDEPGLVREWCEGYLMGARLDDDWRDDEYAVSRLFPMGILAGEVDLVGEEDADGNIIEDPTPQLAKCTESLPSMAVDLYHYWKPRRRTGMPPTTTVRAEPKIGRNEPCPCGSGKKYKKCCAERLH